MEKYINPNSVYIQDGNQEYMILEYIKKKGCITNLEALLNLGVMQCPARIFGLKKKGYNIQTRWKNVEDRYGKTKRVVEYYLANNEGEKAV